MSEFSNAWLKYEYKKWGEKPENKGKEYKKDYFISTEAQKVVDEIKTIIKKILQICEKGSDNFSAIEIDDIFKKAKKEFFDGEADFNDALETTKDRHPEHADSFYNHIKKVTEILNSCSMEKIEEIKKEIKTDVNKKYILEKVCKEVNSFCRKVGIKNQK